MSRLHASTIARREPAREIARLLTKTLPRATSVEVSGAGHMAPLTHPERVNALIERFLEIANT